MARTITARKARDKRAAQLLRQRSATTRAAAKIRRQGTATLATHGIAAGLTVTEARTVAGSLRTAAKRLGVTGRADTTFRKGARRDCWRFTTAEVALIAAAYKPRKAAYVAAKSRLALAA